MMVLTTSFLLSLLDIKQQLMTGTSNLNSYSGHFNRPAGKRVWTEGSLQYTNPLMSSNSPDPAVTRLRDGSGFLLVTTSDHLKSNTSHVFPLYFSEDLIHWRLRSHVFRSSNLPVWAVDRFYAPEVHMVGGRYVLYFTAEDRTGKLSCGAAVAASGDPFGGFEDIGKPLVTAEDSVAGCLDSHVFEDPVSNKTFLLWKQDAPLRLQTSVIHIRELDRTGTRFQGPAREILTSNLKEERLVVEAPWMMYKKGYYYLFYSSGWYFEAKYHMRVAKSKHPAGPFIKRREPILETDWQAYSKVLEGSRVSWVGPGHGSVLEVGGEWWMFYHCWRSDSVGSEQPGRQLLLDRVHWRRGWPSLGVPTTHQTPAPSLARQHHTL